MSDIRLQDLFDGMDQSQNIPEREDKPGIKICTKCRQGGFHWEEVDGRWRLVSAKGEIHKCVVKVDKRL